MHISVCVCLPALFSKCANNSTNTCMLLYVCVCVSVKRDYCHNICGIVLVSASPNATVFQPTFFNRTHRHLHIHSHINKCCNKSEIKPKTNPIKYCMGTNIHTHSHVCMGVEAPTSMHVCSRMLQEISLMVYRLQ